MNIVTLASGAERGLHVVSAGGVSGFSTRTRGDYTGPDCSSLCFPKDVQDGTPIG